MELRQANKAMSRLRIALSGPSGTGKTYSAINIALGITKGDPTKIGLIDSENESADLYAENFRNEKGDTFNVLPLSAPYSPERYIEAIEICERAGMEVILIDSVSHEWNGIGGCLELHAEATENDPKKNSYAAWGVVTPRHNDFIQKILSSPCHIICTVRAKTDYSLVPDGKGGNRVVKLGMGDQTRDGFDFEMTTYFTVGPDHKVEATKDRTALFTDREPFMVTQETGKEFLSWAYNGLDVSELQETIRTIESVEELREIFKKYPSLKKDNSFMSIAQKRAAELEGKTVKA